MTGEMPPIHPARQAAWVLLLISVYVLATQVGLMLQANASGLTPLWPASGLGLAIVWRFGVRWWPVILVGETGTAWLLGQPLTMGLAGGGAQVLEAVLALAIARSAGIRELFRNVRETVYFVFAVCLIPPVLSAAIGTLAQVLHGIAPSTTWQSGWFTWWLGDAMGLLIVTPAILTWWRWPLREWRESLEWALIAGLLVAAGLSVVFLFGELGHYLFFILLPFVAWMAVRFRAAGAASATLILAAMIFGLVTPGHGDPALTAVYVVFVGGSAYTGYLLAAVLSGQRELVRELRHRAAHDPLTGLANRTRFDARLRQLTADRDGSARHAFIYMDLDYFKLVNDTCGHEAGDRLLHDLAGELLAGVPAEVTVARLGGDEFGILVPNTGLRRAEELAHDLRRTVLDYRFTNGEYAFTLGVSMGVVAFQPGDSAAAVLSRGDIACYAAKDEGRDRVHVYRAEELAMRRHRSELEWVSQFHSAMREGELALFGQRIDPVGPDAAATPFFEVLLRKMENGQPTSPGSFLPVASRYGLMPIIDRWVMAECFRLIAANPGTDFRLSINLAAATIDRPRFLKRLEQLTDEHGINPPRVCFEVTETIAIRHMTRAADAINQLSEQGFRFALDDFGSGVASFGYLHQLPLHYVKIDGQFVRNLPDDQESRIIVSSLRDVAGLRGIRCIAEWVESGAILDELARLGIELAQGYYIHEPEPLERALGIVPGPESEAG